MQPQVILAGDDYWFGWWVQVRSRDPATILLIELEPGNGSGAPYLIQYDPTKADA